MAIEIRELVIRATVGAPGSGDERVPAWLEELKREILEECRKEIDEQLRETTER